MNFTPKSCELSAAELKPTQPKPDPEVYVDSGAWKARQGGNGLAAAGNGNPR